MAPPQRAHGALRLECGQEPFSDQRNIHAWTAFWREQGAQACCLQLAGGGVRSALGRHWAALAAGLDAGERVLDLGAGTGAVGKTMLAGRPDLAIDGVDSADLPPGATPGLTLHARVGMEALPFANGGFGLAVSQFGFEYGDPDLAAPELARVLRPGGHFSFLVHHQESTILAANMTRRSALAAIFAGALRTAFLRADRLQLIRVLARLGAAHGEVDIVRQLASVLPARLSLDRAARLAMWQAIEGALAPEQVILDALLQAAQSRHAIAAWLAPLRSTCVDLRAEPLGQAGGDPVAWHVSGRRP